MRSILRILPVALALFASPAAVIPSVVEGPGRAEVRITCRAAVAVAYRQPRVIHEPTPVIVVRVEAPTRLPLRGASTPRAPAA